VEEVESALLKILAAKNEYSFKGKVFRKKKHAESLPRAGAG